ncbi:efflux RND transporter periplasmic adaptor subunit [Persicobacter diffluens]|uniref:RND transporter n=1 Tax=Persicobacter diffluens TaxID=981 RepID=A0AAN4W0M6_9BACT|nr:RND transporter [Persicobacter diffluens]
MKNIYKYTLLLAAAGTLVSCKTDDVDSWKKSINENRDKITELETEINELQAKIKSVDPEYGEQVNPVLISATQTAPATFVHKLEVRGSIESRKNVMVSAEAAGRLLKINVLEGKRVKKGQVIMEIDAQSTRDQIEEVKTNLALAEQMYEKRADLWKENIGTEVDYLQSKTEFESLQNKLNTLKTQLSYAYVKAPFTGTLDYLAVNAGEFIGMNTPLFRLVSDDDKLVRVALSEKYLGTIQTGSQMEFELPHTKEYLTAPIAAVSNVIDEGTRTFTVEARLNAAQAAKVKPNMMVKAKLVDFTKEEAMVVPTEAIMRDHQGWYVFLVEGKGEKQTATKTYVEVGNEYGGLTWVKSGLEFGQQVVTKGQFKLVDGNNVRLS